MRHLVSAVGLALVLTGLSIHTTPARSAETFALEKLHTFITFTVARQGLTRVMGWFEKYEGEIVFDQSSVENSRLKVKIFTNSLDSAFGPREELVMGPNFLNAAGLKKLGALAEEGTITLRGIYRTTCFNTQRIAFTAGVQQNYVVDFEISGDTSDPVVRTFHDGLVFDIRPIIVGSRREIIAELRITHLEVDDPVPVVMVGGSGGLIDAAATVLVRPGPLRMHVPRQAIAKTRTTIRIPEGAGAVFTTPLRGSDRRGKRELLMIVQPKVVDLSVRGR